MTNLEAADLLDNLIGMVSDNHDSDYDEALSKGRDILKSEPCDDCVSRIEALNSLDKVENKDSWYRLTDVMKMIRNLPPVNPQPKTGHWETRNIFPNWLYCSECDEPYGGNDRPRFCPNCGCRMVEPQESEAEG